MEFTKVASSILVLMLGGPVAAEGAYTARGQCTANEFAKFSGSMDNSAFGWSVAIDGDVAVVGAPWEDTSAGAAYVYRFDGSSWERKTTLHASDWANNDYFGCSVAISGDTIVVGAYASGAGTTGAAYVFVEPTGGWPDGIMYETAKLTNSGQTDTYLGFSVSISGDYVVIGAPYANWESGKAYVYKKPVSGWANKTAATATLSAGADADPGDHFGKAVSISGDCLVVGARYDDNDGPANCKYGSAYVFQGSGSSWSQKAKLVAEMPVSHDEFGYSVSISGNTVAIGTYDEDNHETKRGFAYVFKEPTGGWDSVPSPLHEDARLTASDATMNDGFGKSVSISGDIVIAGAWGDDDNGDRSGSAYAFKEPAAGWHDMTETAKLLAFDGASADRLGYSVGISGNIAVVGAYKAGSNDAGRAYAFHGFDDCQTNGTLDICDIAGGTSLDVDPRNGVPDECDKTCLIASDPLHDESLWRTENNVIYLMFDADIVTPANDELLIEVMEDDGLFGTSYTIATDDSADFKVEVVDDRNGDPRILEIWENGSVLMHTDWIAVHNDGGWINVGSFHRYYPVMKGDVNRDNDVLPTDLGLMFPEMGKRDVEPNERADVNGDGDVLPTDFGPMFPYIPTFGADYPKPSGHLP